MTDEEKKAIENMSIRDLIFSPYYLQFCTFSEVKDGILTIEINIKGENK